MYNFLVFILRFSVLLSVLSSHATIIGIIVFVLWVFVDVPICIIFILFIVGFFGTMFFFIVAFLINEIIEKIN